MKVHYKTPIDVAIRNAIKAAYAQGKRIDFIELTLGDAIEMFAIMFPGGKLSEGELDFIGCKAGKGFAYYCGTELRVAA